MFRVEIALGAGVDSREFTFSPALTILNHGTVPVDMTVRVHERERLNLLGLANDPEGFANATFDEHIRGGLPTTSMCANCNLFCLSGVSPHRTTVVNDALNAETVVHIKGATIECKQPCPPALNKEVARKIRNQLLNRGYGPNQIVEHLERLVEIHLTNLRNEANFGSMVSYEYETSSGPVGMPMYTITKKDETSEKSMVMDYLHRALNEHLGEFILSSPKQNSSKNNGIPLTQMESVW